MDARMMTSNSLSFVLDAAEQDARKHAILREAALPTAPLPMPRQVIEVPNAGLVDATTGGLFRLLTLLAQGFGRTARDR